MTKARNNRISISNLLQSCTKNSRKTGDTVILFQIAWRIVDSWKLKWKQKLTRIITGKIFLKWDRKSWNGMKREEKERKVYINMISIWLRLSFLVDHLLAAFCIKNQMKSAQPIFIFADKSIYLTFTRWMCFFLFWMNSLVLYWIYQVQQNEKETASKMKICEIYRFFHFSQLYMIHRNEELWR